MFEIKANKRFTNEKIRVLCSGRRFAESPFYTLQILFELINGFHVAGTGNLITNQTWAWNVCANNKYNGIKWQQKCQSSVGWAMITNRGQYIFFVLANISRFGLHFSKCIIYQVLYARGDRNSPFISEHPRSENIINLLLVFWLELETDVSTVISLDYVCAYTW